MRLAKCFLPLAALTLAVLLPARAWALALPPCQITGPDEARCSATLCGPAGDYLYKWSSTAKGFPGSEAQCITVTLTGTYTVDVIDPRAHSLVFRCSHTIFIEKCGENRPPECKGARAKDAVLWPPNHELDGVVIEGVKDPDGDPVAITVVGITQDEPLDINGDGNTCADAEIVDGQAFVRRERTGDVNNPGNGRVYFIKFIAVDVRGAKCGGFVTVCVPHDMGQGDTCIDDGQFYNSTGDCEPPGE